MQTRLLALSLLALPLFACQPDDAKSGDSGSSEADADADADADSDTDADADADSDADADGPGDITGSWSTSGGGTVGPGLEGFGFGDIDATFNGDGTYIVTGTVRDTAYELTGTYQVDTSTNPGTIQLTQESPENVDSAGIWQVDGDTLTYEVLDVTAGTPATPDGGFGSSVVRGETTDDWIQVYVRD